MLQTRASLVANERTVHNTSFPWFCYQWELPDGDATERFEMRMVPLWSAEERAAFEADASGWLRGLKGAWIVLEVRVHRASCTGPVVEIYRLGR